MPEHFLYLPADERKEILQTAAAQLGQQATVLEKDVWVCWILQTLFPCRMPTRWSSKVAPLLNFT